MVANAVRWTTQDLEGMSDDGGWKRYEIINGELFVTRSPHFFHQDAAGNLYFELTQWSRKSKLGKAVNTPGVVFSAENAVIPDVVWISNKRFAHGVDEFGHFTIAPDLAIEVLSEGKSHEQRDKETKRKLYSIYGVQEYWVVSWQLKTIEVYRRHQAQLVLVGTLLADDVLASPLLPGFELVVGRVFIAILNNFETL